MPRGRPRKVAAQAPAEAAAPVAEEKASECDCKDANCTKCN